MIQVMTHEQAAKRGLYTICPLTGRQIPFTSFRIELTEKRKEEEKKQIEEGLLPF